MAQYCYDIEGETDAETAKNFITKLYKKNKFEGHFEKEEDLPFLTIFSKENKQICIKMTSRAKKNIERIEEIHKQLKAVDLKIDKETKLSKPKLFELEQCQWWEKLLDTCKDGTGLKGNIKWTSLEHKGPYFTHIEEPYEPHKTKIIYDGKKYSLEPKEEQIATFYARRLASEKAGGVTIELTKDSIFNKNFWNDFKEYLTDEHKKIFKEFNKFNFKPFVEYLENKKETEKSDTELKQTKKIKTAERKQDYGYAMINGTREPLGNFVIEPAAIFFGRGENPNRGKIKRDIDPEEVTINIGKNATIPKAPSGHKWKEVINDQESAWIAKWNDPISGDIKYVYFAAEGQLKGKSDLLKYEKARKLNEYIDKVRKTYTQDSNSTSKKSKQLGTVLYLIDNYGLRVGGEKDEDETDTVGASTVRVEHIKLNAPDTIVFDFLGKDSIRYYKEIAVDPAIFKNFQEFIKNKKPSDLVFDQINATEINNYLKTFDKDFSAKVFRTRLASTTMDAALKETKIKKNADNDEKKKLFDKANLQVAEILNHRRTVSAKAQETMTKYKDQLKDLKKELKNADSDKEKEKIKKKIKKKQDQIESKNDTLTVALTTSRTNYIDPRIVVAWTKKYELPISKVYTAVLQRKFKWALDMTDSKWDYTKTELLPEMKKLQPLTAEEAKKVQQNETKKSEKKTIRKRSEKKTSQTKPITEINLTSIKLPNDTKFIVYKNSLAVVGLGTKNIKEQLLALRGKPNANLTVNNEKRFGYIFAGNRKEELSKIFGKEPEIVSTDSDTKEKISNDIKIDEFDKNIVITGNYSRYEPEFEKLGKKVENLNIKDKKTTGWVFSKTKIDAVMKIIESKLPEETSKVSRKTSEKTSEKNSEKKTSDKALLFEIPEKELKIYDYSDNVYLIVGSGTKQIKTLLQEKGGKPGNAFTINGVKVFGWMFKKKEYSLEQLKGMLGKYATNIKSNENLENFYTKGTKYNGYTLNELLELNDLEFEKLELKNYLQKLENPKLAKKGITQLVSKFANLLGYTYNTIDKKFERDSPIEKQVNGVTVGLYSPGIYPKIVELIKFLNDNDFTLLAKKLILVLCLDTKTDKKLKLLIDKFEMFPKLVKSVGINLKEI